MKPPNSFISTRWNVLTARMCALCVRYRAIFALDDLPEKWNEFTAKNAAYFGR